MERIGRPVLFLCVNGNFVNTSHESSGEEIWPKKYPKTYRGQEISTKGRIPRQYVYEEMLFTLYEMKSGVAEDQAYEQFGERCALQPYTRLAGLLTQSIRKGNAALLADLRKESSDAQEERRNLVRKKGEEAGTKLLLPMMMMGIVMIIIMVPAFLSLS